MVPAVARATLHMIILAVRPESSGHRRSSQQSAIQDAKKKPVRCFNFFSTERDSSRHRKDRFADRSLFFHSAFTQGRERRRQVLLPDGPVGSGNSSLVSAASRTEQLSAR